MAAEDVRTIRVEFAAGNDTAVLTDRMQGRDYVVYKLNAREGQFLSVSLRPDNLPSQVAGARCVRLEYQREFDSAGGLRLNPGRRSSAASLIGTCPL